MEMSINLEIPEEKIDMDFTIIYKGKEESGEEPLYEIKTSKYELMRKLRYFRKKANEFNYMDEIYIHENIKYDFFKEFIDSILNKRLQINEHNYSTIYELSIKYEYIELQKQIESFIQVRPDLKLYASELSNSDNQEHNDDAFKEELIAKNIDICLQNGYINCVPLQNLIKILNSPKCDVKNHHLLFKIVIEKIDKYKNERISKEDEEILQMLPSCLDFLKMNSDEIKELISKSSSSIFFPKNSEKMIDLLSTEIDKMKKSLFQQENKNKELTSLVLGMKRQMENNHNAYEKQFNEIGLKFFQQNKIIEEQKSSISTLEQKNKELEEKTQNIIKDQKSSIFTLEQKNKELEGKIQKIVENQQYEIKSLPYTNGRHFNGIMNYLTSKTNSNIHDNGTISITTTDQIITAHPENLVNYNSENVYSSNDSKFATVCFNFKEKYIQPTSYSIRSCSSNSSPHLKNWIIEVSNDGKNWDEIDRHENDSNLNEDVKDYTFNIQKQTHDFYHFIRIRQIGNSWYKDGCHNKIILRRFEVFGKLKELI